MTDPGLLTRIAEGRTDLIFDHLANGGSAEATHSGASIMRWCAYYGDVSAIRELLRVGEKLTAHGGNYDLSGAAFHGHWTLCEFLLEAGADPSFRSPANGETALHAALTKAGGVAQERVVAVLLAAGADCRRTTLHGAETGGFMRDVRTRGETPLHRAAAFGSEAVVERLISAGAQIDARDQYGDSPLSWASWHLRPSAIVRLLLFGEHRLHDDAFWTGDHGVGLPKLVLDLQGRPQCML